MVDYLFVLLPLTCQVTLTEDPSKQVEFTQQQGLETPSSSVILKKKERTPEEGSKAICRTALLAAFSSRGLNHKTTADTSKKDIRGQAPSVCPAVKSPAVLKWKNTSAAEDSGSSPRVVTHRDNQEGNAVSKAGVKVSPVNGTFLLPTKL